VKPSAVLFDFGGTLDATGLAWKDRMLAVCRAEGVDVRADRFDSAFYRADDALVGAIPATLTLSQTVHRLVAGLADALDLGNGGRVDRIAARFVEDASRAVRANLSILTALARRYRLGIVSNFYGNLETVCTDLGLRPLFPVIVDSTVVGCVKPHPKIFAVALDALGVAPAEATFVGDSLPRDMAGARAVGMAHVWLAGSHVREPRACCAEDRVIRSLDELPELFS
jgi:putative hydrolase of the HAD superfamily